MNRIYYVYRHIRVDKNEPFYIGIGYYNCNQRYISKHTNYQRAYSKKERNKHWTNVFNKTKYKVEILMEDKNLDFIKQKEIEFISLYGRKDLKKGILVNMTNGGDGCFGCIPNDYSKKVSSDMHSIPIYQYTIDNKFIRKWKSTQEASNSLNITDTNIYKCLKNKAFHAGNFIWKKEITDNLPKIRHVIKNRPIIQETLNNVFVKRWSSAREIEKILKFNASSIAKCCKNKIKTMYKYKWKYE